MIDPWQEWQPVKERLPSDDELCLVKGETHSGVALGRFDFATYKWTVQPFKAVWYQTKNGITHWKYIYSPGQSGGF